MGFTDFRLKIRHFYRKNKKILIIGLSVWGIIIMVNHMLKNREVSTIPTTTYEPHISVMSQASSTPKALQTPIEDLIDKYVEYCNTQDYESAFFMISKDCREYEFDNSPGNYLRYVLTKMPSPRKYSIQNYSNVKVDGKTMYIYEIKYTEDMLATGLTDTDYYYTSEKMAFYEDDNGVLQMNIGNYIYQTPIQNISENEYLKIDVISKTVNYETEEYEIKFTNRSDYTVVIADGYGNVETELQLNGETRKRKETTDIVLEPKDSTTRHFTFEKFVDDKDSSNSLIFGSIRVMENYLKTDEEVLGQMTEEQLEEIKQAEIDNALAKFSMTVSLK